jgi:hypothetical protein
MERRLLPLWVLVAPRNPNPQASLRIGLLDEERLLQLSQPGVNHLARPGASFHAFALFMGISMSITSFPVFKRGLLVLLAVQLFDGSTSPIAIDLGPQFCHCQ